MSRTTMTSAFAAFLALSMPMAMAQTMNTTNRAGAAPPPASVHEPANAARAAGKVQADAVPNHVQSGEIRFSDMNGATVYDKQNKSIGDINNVVLDENGNIAAVVVKHGGFIGIGGKTIAVPMRDITVTAGQDGKPRFVLDMSENQVKSAQSYSLSPPKNTETGSSAPPRSAPPPPPNPAPKRP